ERFSAHFARAVMFEMKLLKELDRRLALHEGVERDLEVILILAELQRRLHQRAADPAAAKLAANAQPSNLALALLVMLHADHPDDLPIRRLGDPEMISLML